jgi:stress response protein YsnF
MAMTDVADLDPAGIDPTMPDRAMTRAEEQLNVGVQVRPTTRAVLRKYIVTEEVTRTFTIRHEEVRLEQIPVDDVEITASASAAFEPEEYEVVLHEERPVISTEVVPVERVRLRKEVVTEYVAVGDQLRMERIDLDVDDRHAP